MMLPGGVAVNSGQFEMDSWTGAQRTFAVKSFYIRTTIATLPPHGNIARNSGFIETVK
jgi:hypothetical protein